MLLEPYQKLKEKLTGINLVKKIDYFNDQYSGILHTIPVLFIEFPETLRFETISKQQQQADFKARIHVVSKVMQNADKSIDENSIGQHFTICNDVFFRLQGYRADDGTRLIFNSLTRTVFEHHQEMQGFMVTTQDFEGIIYAYLPELQKIGRPDVEIE